MRETSLGCGAVILTEREIFDRLQQSLKRAISLCTDLATQPKSGANFHALRAELKLIEGSCRQAAVWREDTRWLQPALKAEQAHQIARIWLDRPTVSSKKLFAKLGDVLRQWVKDLEALKTGKTGRRGIILPDNGFVKGMPEAPRLALPSIGPVFTPRGMPAGLIAPPL